MSDISPETQEFLYFLAYLYFKNGKFDKAYTLLTLLADLQPRSIRVNSVLGMIQLKKEANDAAMTCAHRVLKYAKKPEDERIAYYILSRACLAKNQLNAAKTHFNKFLEIHAQVQVKPEEVEETTII